MKYQLRLDVFSDRDQASFTRTVEIDDAINFQTGDIFRIGELNLRIKEIGYDHNNLVRFIVFNNEEMHTSQWHSLIEKGWS